MSSKMLVLLSNQNFNNLCSCWVFSEIYPQFCLCCTLEFVYLSFLGFYTQNTICQALIPNWFSKSLINRYYKLQTFSQLTNFKKLCKILDFFFFCQTPYSWLSLSNVKAESSGLNFFLFFFLIFIFIFFLFFYF